MSLHSSLKRAEKMTAKRSVMKRNERIKWLEEKGAWKDHNKVTGLPKIKVLKVKAAKKEKKEEAKPAEGAAAGATPAAS